jgi:hypothetical protein
MEWVLQVSLLDGDEALAARVNAPLDLEVVNLAPIPQRDADHPMTFFSPMA